MNDLIIKYLNRETTPEEKKQLLDWLKEDQANKKIFTEIRDIWLLSESTTISDNEVQQAFHLFKQHTGVQKNKRGKQQSFSFLRIAASIAVLLICTLGGYFGGKKSTVTDTTKNMLVMNQVIMGNESKGSVTLPDGTIVWLNANTKITYPETFSKDIRKVELKGEAYFDVIPNAQAPFIVVSDQMEVNVIGTKFDIKNYPEQSNLETTLITGKVQVRFSPDHEFITLAPNQTISFDKQKDQYDIHQVEAKDYIIWTDDKLTFTNEPLSDILYKMEKWYNIRITYTDNVDLNQRLSFTIRKENKEEIFKLLELIAPIKSNINGYDVFIRKK